MAAQVTDLGHILGARGSVQNVSGRAAVLRVALPPDPFETLFTARIPEPPKLNPSSGADTRALLVVRAYLGALKKAKLKPTQWQAYARTDRQPDITKAKAYPTLRSFVDLFTEHEIPPAAWAVFRLEVLRHAHKKKPGDQIEMHEPVEGSGPFKVPTLPVLMSEKWLADKQRRGWFRREFSTWGWRGKVITTSSRDILMQLWSGLQSDLDSVSDLTVEKARALYQLRFPGDLLSTLIQRAESEARERQNHYDVLAARGEWLW